MKFKLLFAFNLLFLVLIAQNVPDPDFENRPYYVTTGNQLKTLERASATIDAKMKGIYGGSEIYLTTFEKYSDTKFDAKNLPMIVIKLDGNADPYEVVSIVKGEQHKEIRRFLQRDQSLAGGARDISDIYVKADFKKIRDGLWQVILPENIANGEYAFMPLIDMGLGSMSSKMYISCFNLYNSDYGEESSSEKKNEISEPSGSNSREKATAPSEKLSVRFGARVGLGFSKTTYNPQFIFGFLAGFTTEIPVFRDYLSIQTGFDIQKGGGKDELYPTVYVGDLYYFRIPATVKGGYRFNNGMKIFAAMGPNLGIGLFGTWKRKDQSLGTVDKTNIFNYYKRIDFAWNTEIGAEFTRNIAASVLFNNGIINIDKTPFSKDKNMLITFNFYYMFGKNKTNKPTKQTYTEEDEEDEGYQEYLRRKAEQEEAEKQKEEEVQQKSVEESKPTFKTCGGCNGTGFLTTESNVLCTNHCNKGKINCTQCKGTGRGESQGNKFNPVTKKVEPIYQSCSVCNGSGIQNCPVCNGNGIELKTKKTECNLCGGTGKTK